MGFEHRLRVRFQDVDAAGIIFFSRYFEKAHEAFEEWMEAAGLPVTAEMMARREVGLPLVQAGGEFHSPALLGEELCVAVEVERLGASSVTYVFHFTGPAGQKRATVRTTHVCIDPQSFRSRPWPEAMRAALAAAAG